MRHLRATLARLLGMREQPDLDEDLRAEMQAHLEMEIAEHIRRGMTPEDARRAALLNAGGITQAAEAVRDRRGVPWLQHLAEDARYALRALRRAPAFSLIVVLTLALGLGANTAIFTVIRGVLLKPLPHRDGDRLVYLRHSNDGPGGDDIGFSVPEVRDLRNGVPALAGIAEYSSWTLIHQSDEGASRLRVGLVTGNYFEVMGLSAIHGRVTGPADDGPGVPPVAVLTHDFWMDRFGGDASIVGRQITLDKRSVTVIGVLQPAPFFPDRIDALLNMVVSDHHLSASMVEGRSHRMTEVVARLTPAATIGDVDSQVQAVYQRMQGQHTNAYDPAAHFQVAVLPFRDVLGERARLTLLLLMGAAAFVLVISVANVANLTLMRGVRREHELVVRAALGAGLGRLRRLLLAENVLLALTGGSVGLVLALAGTKLLRLFAQRYSPRADEIQFDGVVFGFMVALSLVVAMVLSYLGAVPRDGRFATRLLSGGQRTRSGHGRHRLQRALVVVQVAVSVVLLAGAGLLTRTMVQISEVDTGLGTEEILTMQVNLLTPTELMTNPAADIAAKQRYEEMRAEMATLPGVLEVGVGSPLPLRRSDVMFEVKAEGKTPAAGAVVPRAEVRTASPEFFRASGIPVVAGRHFERTDGPASGKVVAINQVLADLFFPGEDPIGKRIAWTGEVLRFTPISGEWRTIVGVVGNTRDGGLDMEPRAVVYMPFQQMLALGGGFVVRADSNVATHVPAATRIVRKVAPTAPIENVSTIAQYKDRSVSPRRLNAMLIAALGVLALVIAAVGIAGVLAFSVSARTSEIGIRMSLGADGGRVQRMILGEGGALIALGLILGVVGAYAVAGVIRGLLFGVAPRDPMTFATVTVLMALIGVAASWWPAHRASRIDPAIAMRT